MEVDKGFELESPKDPKHFLPRHMVVYFQLPKLPEAGVCSTFSSETLMVSESLELDPCKYTKKNIIYRWAHKQLNTIVRQLVRHLGMMRYGNFA